MSGECCHHVLNAAGEVLDSFPLLCVGVPDHECCEPHGEDRVFPARGGEPTRQGGSE